MAGLNDEFLLADDSMEPKAQPAAVIHAFKDTEDGEIPELRDDIDLIAVATEDLGVQLRDLELLQENIRNTGGMCQSIALEAEALMPGFLHDERPMEYFTKHPSRTMLQTALEEIEEKKNNILQKVKDFVVSMYQKVIDWFKSVFERIRKSGLFSKENEQLLEEAPKVVEQVVLLLTHDPSAKDDSIAQAKAKAEQLAREADHAVRVAEEALAKKEADAQALEAAKARAALLHQMHAFVKSVKPDDDFAAAMLSEVNARLGRAPNVQRVFAEPELAETILVGHEKAIAAVIVLLADMERGVRAKNYEFVSKVTSDTRFEEVAKHTEEHAKILAQFKGIAANYAVSNLDEFVKLVRSKEFAGVLRYGSEMLGQDQADQERLLGEMEDMIRDLYRMDLYTSDPSKAALAKQALDALKTFNQQIIVPTTQRLTFSFSLLGQLLTWLKSMPSLKSDLLVAQKEKLRDKVLVKAKEIGMSSHEALSILG